MVSLRQQPLLEPEIRPVALGGRVRRLLLRHVQVLEMSCVTADYFKKQAGRKDFVRLVRRSEHPQPSSGVRGQLEASDRPLCTGILSRF